ncbi:MAG: MATE family efflux transporter [Uliginosibacterium sp.]|nr:MATE family efflux transporter [Uliginosibacterium sp.]
MARPVPDLTRGSVARHLIRLAMPVLVGHVLMLGYGLADSYFISQIDPQSTALMSGVGTVFPIYFFFLAIALGMGAGTASLVARAVGARDEQALSQAGDSGLVMALGLAVLSSTVFVLGGDWLVGVIAGPALGEESRAVARSFLHGMVPGFAILPVNHVLGGILQGEGRMLEAVKSMVLSLLLNIVLDPLFIFGFGWGVIGAGVATSLSIFAGAGYLFWVLLRQTGAVRIHFARKAVRLETIAEIARVGAPNAGSLMFMSVCFVAVNHAIGALGEDVMTAWALVGRADDTILLIGYALSSAVLTFAGQNAAAGHWERVRASLRGSMALGTLGSLVLALLYSLFAPKLFGVMSENPSVIAHCVQQVRWIAWTYAGVVAAIIFNAFFLGLGRPWPGVAATVLRMGCVIVPVMLWLVFVRQAGIDAVLIAFAVLNALSLPLMWGWAEWLLARRAMPRSLAMQTVP